MVAPEAVNERDLALDRATDGGNSRVAVYPVEKLPKADQKEAVPVDRKQGLKDCEEAEAALKKLKRELTL